MSVSISLNTDGPRDPQYVLEVAEALSGAVKVLNHLTRDHASLEYPSEADRLIRELSSAVSRFPQLLAQVGTWIAAEQEAGRIVMAPGKYAGHPDLAAESVKLRFDAASALARMLAQELEQAAAVTSGMAAAESGGAGAMIPACPRCGTMAPDIAQTGGDDGSRWACTACGHEWEDGARA